MLTRPTSCGVTATIDAMRSVELVPRFSPFDELYEEHPDHSVVTRLQEDRERPSQVGEPICEA